MDFDLIFTVGSFFPLALLGASFFLYRKKKKLAWILLTAGLFAAFVELIRASVGYLGPPFNSVLGILLHRDLVPVVVGVVFALTLYRISRNLSLGVETIPDNSDPAALRIAVAKILDSESFLTALRSTLPQGKDDQQYGLDYIPFMLHSVDERRKRAVRSARMFLLAIVVAALTFSSVVMYFGYILVNEAAAGTAKSVADLKSATQRVSDTVQSMIPSHYNNPRFQREVARSLEKLTDASLNPGDRNNEVQGKIRNALNQARNTGDFTALGATLAQARDTVSRGNDSERTYATAVADSADRLTEFINAQSSALPELANRASELKLLISKAEII
jgi:hypothetical protein